MYFKAIGLRLDKLSDDPIRDKQHMGEVMSHWQQYLKKQTSHPSPALETYRWMIEEFRISLFAQGTIKTAYPISSKRLDKQWEQC